jgi:hypothetical protein
MNTNKIEAVLSEFKEQVASLQSIKTSYDHEAQYRKFWNEAGRKIYEASLSDNLDVKKGKKNDENESGRNRDTQRASFQREMQRLSYHTLFTGNDCVRRSIGLL